MFYNRVIKYELGDDCERTDILKAIQKLNPAEKHRLREYLIDALNASSSTENVLEEISERKNKDGYGALIVSQNILCGLENTPLS